VGWRFHDIWVELLLDNVEAMVQAISGLLEGSWGLWYQIVTGVGYAGYVVVMVADYGGCGLMDDVAAVCGYLEGVVDWLRNVASAPAVDPIVALVGGGCRRYTTTLLASHTPC
jgi:hypothetical protein